jgi:hypothetical protein
MTSPEADVRNSRPRTRAVRGVDEASERRLALVDAELVGLHCALRAIGSGLWLRG